MNMPLDGCRPLIGAHEGRDTLGMPYGRYMVSLIRPGNEAWPCQMVCINPWLCTNPMEELRKGIQCLIAGIYKPDWLVFELRGKLRF